MRKSPQSARIFTVSYAEDAGLPVSRPAALDQQDHMPRAIVTSTYRYKRPPGQ